MECWHGLQQLRLLLSLLLVALLFLLLLQLLTMWVLLLLLPFPFALLQLLTLPLLLLPVLRCLQPLICVWLNCSGRVLLLWLLLRLLWLYRLVNRLETLWLLPSLLLLWRQRWQRQRRSLALL
jgi:hypothetical protein